MKNKKLISILGLVTVVANLGVATVFAANPTGTQVLGCDVETSQTFQNDTPANISFSSANVSASDQNTTATMRLDVRTCTSGTVPKIIQMYAGTNFVDGTKSIGIAENLTVLNATTTNMTCAEKTGSCSGTIDKMQTADAQFLGLTSTNAIPLYRINTLTNGLYSTDPTGKANTGVNFQLKVPGGTPSGTYIANFTVEIIDGAI